MKKSLAVVLSLICFSANAQLVQRQDNIEIRNNTINNDYPAARAQSFAARPTSPCVLTGGFGAQGQPLGISFTGSKDSMNCWYLEYFKVIMEAGDEKLAWNVLYASPIMKEVFKTNKPTIVYEYPNGGKR